MAQLSLGDLKLGLHDFFADKKKHAVFDKTDTAKVYLPLLREQAERIDALPPALVDEGRPLAAQLGEADVLHDAWGLAIWHLNEAYRVAPKLDAALRAITAEVNRRVIARPADVRDAYPTEAARAADRKKAMPALKAGLAKFPVVGGTLADWVAAYNAAGEAIGTLLAARGAKAAETEGEAPDGSPLVIRAETIGLLNRARTTLADEVRRNKKLPRNLDAQLFGYFDTLLASRAAREAQAEAAPPVAAPAPESGGTPAEATPAKPKARRKAAAGKTRRRQPK